MLNVRKRRQRGRCDTCVDRNRERFKVEDDFFEILIALKAVEQVCARCAKWDKRS